MSFKGTLTLIFIVLKCVGIINWSWLCVLSPIWIPWAIKTIVDLDAKW